MTADLHFDETIQPVVKHPVQRAAILAALYVVICVIYIYLSSLLAARIADTPEQLQRIETLKGFGFILVSGLFFYLILARQLTLIQYQEKTLIDRERALLHSERRAVAGMFSAGLAHDLNNLLMALGGLMDDLKSDSSSTDHNPEMLHLCEDTLQHIGDFAQRISAIARETGACQDPDSISLQEELPTLLNLARKHPDIRRTRLDTEDPWPDCSLLISRNLLHEAILNLLINAAQAAGDGGHISLRCHMNAQRFFLEVHDSGPGIEADQIEQIFEPCHTTKPNGTGLGLLSVKAFAAASNAKISVEHSPLGGACFRLNIPKSPPQPDDQPHPHSSGAGGGRRAAYAISSTIDLPPACGGLNSPL